LTGPTGPGVTIQAAAANRVLTGTGTSSNVAQAQSNLTFDGTTLTVTSNVVASVIRNAITPTTFDISEGSAYFTGRLGVGTNIPTYTLDVSGNVEVSASSATTALTITSGTDEQSLSFFTGSVPPVTYGAFSTTYDGNLNTAWNPQTTPTGNIYRLNWSWSGTQTVRLVRLVVGASGVHFPTRIIIHSDSGRTAQIFDSGAGLTLANYFAFNGYYAYDCLITTPTAGTRLWFSLTYGSFQTIIHEIYFYTSTTSSVGVQIVKTDVNGTTFNKIWDEFYQTSNAYWRLLTDDAASASNWLNVTRSGIQTSSIRFSLGTASNIERLTLLSNGNVGVGISAPAYPLDVSGALTTAAVNMNSWPRYDFANVTIVSGVVSLTPVGRTMNFSNATVTMNSNLSTWESSNATVGSSFRPLVAGIWSINVQGFINTNGQWAWIDGSANNSATFASQGHNTVGNQNLSFAQPAGTAFSLHYTGYLSASNYYKIKISTAAAAGNNYWNAIFTFLGQTSTTTAYPTRTT
jgi:hypothetical protein